MSNTSEMRAAWAPACSDHRGSMQAAYRALDDVLRKWKYAPEKGITGAYNCRVITGGSNYSLHAYKDGELFTFWNGTRVTMAAAVDINWPRNPYGPRLITDMPRGMVEEITAIRTANGKVVWGWGGYYSGKKDAMHFELRVTAADIRSGIRGVLTIHAATEPKEEPMTPDERKAFAKLEALVNGLVNKLNAAEERSKVPGLKAPIVDGAAHPKGQGYWLVAADGGVFNRGVAGFFGSLGEVKLDKPVVSIESSATGNGYWIVMADGGIANFGDAEFKGTALKGPE